MNKLSTRNAEREQRLKTGATERTDDAIMERALNPDSVAKTRSTFSASLSERATGETKTLPTSPITPAYSKPLAQVMSNNEGILPRYADAFAAMAMRVERGVPLPQALREGSLLLPPREATALQDAATRMETGTTPGVALRAQGKNLHPFVALILEVAEKNGRTEWALRNCEGAFRKLMAAERKLDWSVMHPVVTHNVKIGAVAWSLSFVLSCLVFLPYLPMVLGIYGLGTAGFYALRKRLLANNPNLWGKLALKAPGRGDVELNFESAEWLRSFSVLWGANVPVSVALDASAERTKNPHYAKLLREVANETRRGTSLSASLQKSNLLPSRLVDFIKTAEATGDFDVLLNAHADYLTDEAKQSAAQWFGLIVILIWAFNGGVTVYGVGAALGAPLGLLRLVVGIYLAVCIPAVYWLWIGALDRRRK